MTGPIIDPAAAALRVSLYEDGYSIAEIAAAAGTSHQNISAWLIRHGYHYPVRRSPATTADRRQAVEWYGGGLPVDAICARFSVNVKTLYRDVRRAGVPLRRPDLSASLSRPRPLESGEQEATR